MLLAVLSRKPHRNPATLRNVAAAAAAVAAASAAFSQLHSSPSARQQQQQQQHTVKFALTEHAVAQSVLAVFFAAVLGLHSTPLAFSSWFLCCVVISAALKTPGWLHCALLLLS